MICLLCGQEFSEKETFLGIITMRKSRYLICKECQENFEKIIQLIFENELFDEEGMLIVEHSKHTKLDNLSNFSFSKSYGGSVFSFYEFESDEEEEFEDEDEG